METRQLMDFFKAEGRFGVLSTADREGAVNAAIFGSARLLDTQTLALGLGDNRTLDNLKRNPQGVFLCFEPGATLLAWQGARLYLEVAEIASRGPLFDEIVAETARRAGRAAARGLRAVVTFRITGIRALVEFARNPGK